MNCGGGGGIGGGGIGVALALLSGESTVEKDVSILSSGEREGSRSLRRINPGVGRGVALAADLGALYCIC